MFSFPRRNSSQFAEENSLLEYFSFFRVLLPSCRCPHNFRNLLRVLAHAHFLLFRELFRHPCLNLPQICIHVRGEREHVSSHGGRGLRFFVFRRIPSPLPFLFFVVSFSTEQSRSFPSAPSNSCAPQKQGYRSSEKYALFRWRYALN